MMLLRPVVAFAVAFLVATPASSHCDGLDGPVVAAAQKALALSDASAVLIWVKPRDEAEVRHAFDEALGVRKLGPQARQMADRYFYETLVRLHRAGEGAPYTGLKPAGRDLGPAIPLADKAVSSDSDQQIASFLAGERRKPSMRNLPTPSGSGNFKQTISLRDANMSRAMSPSCIMSRHCIRPRKQVQMPKHLSHRTANELPLI